MDSIIKISPAIFAVLGLLIFMIAQFLKQRNKIIFSITGLLFIGLFLYKLLIVQNEVERSLAFTDAVNSSFQLTFSQLNFFMIGINVLGLALWLFAILKVAFEKTITKQSQMAILLTGGLVLVASIIVYKILGSIVGFVCFPLLTISFYFAYKTQYKRIQFFQYNRRQGL